MLRLVHPAPEGQATRPRRGRRSATLFLTAEEVRHLRTATRNAARAYGGAAVLAQVIGVPVQTIHNVTGSPSYRPSGTLAIRIARAAGLSTEAILSGQLSTAGSCSVCGSRIGAGRVAS